MFPKLHLKLPHVPIVINYSFSTLGHACRATVQCSGILAWVMLGYFRLIGVYRPLLELMEAKTIDEQKHIYKTKIEKRMWNPVIMWFLERSFTLALLNGVPEAQRELLEKEGGFKSIGLFIKDSMETIMTKLPIHDNYFYRVYLTGEYTKDCCPDYLTEEGFKTLKNGAVDKISIHTTTITEFLREHKKKDISRFVLLDHMDWMASAPKVRPPPLKKGPVVDKEC